MPQPPLRLSIATVIGPVIGGVPPGRFPRETVAARRAGSDLRWGSAISPGNSTAHWIARRMKNQVSARRGDGGQGDQPTGRGRTGKDRSRVLDRPHNPCPIRANARCNRRVRRDRDLIQDTTYRLSSPSYRRGASMATRNAIPNHNKRFLSIVMPVLLLGVLTDQTSKSWADLRRPRPVSSCRDTFARIPREGDIPCSSSSSSGPVRRSPASSSSCPAAEAHEKPPTMSPGAVRSREGRGAQSALASSSSMSWHGGRFAAEDPIGASPGLAGDASGSGPHCRCVCRGRWSAGLRGPRKTRYPRTGQGGETRGAAIR